MRTVELKPTKSYQNLHISTSNLVALYTTQCYYINKEVDFMLSETITIKVSAEQKKILQELADKEKRSLSNYIKVKLGLI